jgi:hypothetical protein
MVAHYRGTQRDAGVTATGPHKVVDPFYGRPLERLEQVPVLSEREPRIGMTHLTGDVVSAGGKLTQIAGIELTHPQQKYYPDLIRSGGDDITHAGRQDGEAAAGVARLGRLDS